MKTLAKWATITPAAAVMTAGLFMGMRGLISGEWQPQETSLTQKFEINPVVEDIKVIVSVRNLKPYKKVETPPPPPMIDRVSAQLPTEPIATMVGAIPEFKIPKLNRDVIAIALSDTDVQPLVRIPPVTPPRFLEGDNSGHCRVQFDVNAEGSPYNVAATYCTASMLEGATVKSVQKWRFKPKVLNGRNVVMQGVQNMVTFQLLDERGELLPEPGY